MWLDNKGNVSIIVALCLPMVIGGAAFGIEVGYWRYDQVRLQQAADAAAYAGAWSSDRAARRFRTQP